MAKRRRWETADAALIKASKQNKLLLQKPHALFDHVLLSVSCFISAIPDCHRCILSVVTHSQTLIPLP